MWQNALPSFYFYCYLLRLPSMLHNIFSMQEPVWFFIKVKSCHREIWNPLSAPHFTRNSKSPGTQEVFRGPAGRHCCASCMLASLTQLWPRRPPASSDSPGSLTLWPWLLVSTLPGVPFLFGFAWLTSSAPSSTVPMSASQWGLPSCPFLTWLLLCSPFFRLYRLGLYVRACSVVSNSLWPVDCSPPASSVHGISQEGYWSGLPFPPPGDLPNPRMELGSTASPALAGRLFTMEPPALSQAFSPSYTLYNLHV